MNPVAASGEAPGDALGPKEAHFAEVAVATGLRQILTYEIRPEDRARIVPGHRVEIPLGRRRAVGYVVSTTDRRPDVARLRSIVDVDPPEPLFDPPILSLTRWISTYYLAPWGQVLDAALPPNVRTRGSSDRRRKEPEQAAGIETAAEAEPELFPAQKAALEAISTHLARERFVSFLLHGVTGSGKTEVYLRLAREVIGAGGQVLFLVPEIAMGTQILARVRRRFGEAVGLFHSQAGDAQRRNVWRWAREGAMPLVVGARSAVFVPMPNLRLIIVDEEHESAYKQEETPRYHGRDVALMRAREAKAVVVLGSATPSLESLHNVQTGKHEFLQLPERIDGRSRARVVLCDLSASRDTESGGDSTRGRSRGRQRPSGVVVQGGSSPDVSAAQGSGAVGSGAETPRSEAMPTESGRADPSIISPVLARALHERLDRGEQSILFLNRRGHSTVVQCGDCGASVQCHQCDVVMTYHRSDQRLRCHYCNAQQAVPEQCPQCDGRHFFYGGVGTQRLEEELRAGFPTARVSRLDRDATRRKGTHASIVEAMEQREIDILLGTQMVAKGFDFPGVTLVGVLQADQEMLLPDFRATERAFQILTQVAGRSGRGTQAGDVVFQTYMPDHYVVRCASEENFAAFAEEEMSMRQAFDYPPYRRMAHVLVDGPDAGQVERRAEAVRELLLDAAREHRYGVRVIGPAPMPVSRLKGQYRWHLCLTGKQGGQVRALASLAIETKAPSGLSRTRVQADIDPMQML